MLLLSDLLLDLNKFVIFQDIDSLCLFNASLEQNCAFKYLTLRVFSHLVLFKLNSNWIKCNETHIASLKVELVLFLVHFSSDEGSVFCLFALLFLWSSQTFIALDYDLLLVVAFMWNKMAATVLLLSLCSPYHPKPSWLGLWRLGASCTVLSLRTHKKAAYATSHANFQMYKVTGLM